MRQPELREKLRALALELKQQGASLPELIEAFGTVTQILIIEEKSNGH